MEMTTALALAAALSAAGQQVAENLFGQLLHGPLMRIGAIGTTIGLAFGMWALSWGPTGFDLWDPGRVLVFGLMAGFGSNILDGLVARYAPNAKTSTLAEFVGSLAAGGPKPPRQ